MLVPVSALAPFQEVVSRAEQTEQAVWDQEPVSQRVSVFPADWFLPVFACLMVVEF